MSRPYEALKHNKLCPRRSLLARCAALIAALICVLSTSVCAEGQENYIYNSVIVNQDFTYFEYKNAKIDAGYYQAYSLYGVVDSVYDTDNNYDYVHMRVNEGASGYVVKYIYLPLFVTTSVQIDLFTAGATASVTAHNIIAVDAINDGVSTSCDFVQADEVTDEMSLIESDSGVISGHTANMAFRTCSVTTPGRADILRITVDTTSIKTINVGVFKINPIVNVSSISQGIQNIISTINQQTTDINNNNNNNTQSILNTVIKYGDDANYYLEAITYATQDQQLIVSTTQQKFSTALQALQAQNQIIHNNIINNAPTENQVQQVINKEQIAPDVDVAVIGGGTSDSGIGIIMSQTKVIAMMVLVMGIAILSYLLFGRKT